MKKTMTHTQEYGQEKAFLHIMVSTRFSKSKYRTMQDNAGHFGAFLQDIDIAKCRTLQDISPEKMKNAGQCSTFLPSSKKNTNYIIFLPKKIPKDEFLFLII